MQKDTYKKEKGETKEDLKKETEFSFTKTLM